MKSSIKTLAMWLIVGIIVIVLITSILDNADTKMTYSELIESIQNSEVAKIDMSYNGKTANITLKNDNVKKEVNIPNLESFMNYITEYLKNGTVEFNENSQSIIITILEVLSPFGLFIIFIIFWLLTMNPASTRKQQNIELWKKQSKNDDIGRQKQSNICRCSWS